MIRYAVYWNDAIWKTNMQSFVRYVQHRLYSFFRSVRVHIYTALSFRTIECICDDPFIFKYCTISFCCMLHSAYEGTELGSGFLVESVTWFLLKWLIIARLIFLHLILPKCIHCFISVQSKIQSLLLCSQIITYMFSYLRVEEFVILGWWPPWLTVVHGIVCNG